MVPVVYQIVSKGEAADNTVRTVLLNGQPAFVWDSRTTCVEGNEPGTGGGVTSGVTAGECKPIESDKTTRARGEFVIRDGDRFMMNKSNCIGIAVWVGDQPSLPVERRRSLIKAFVEERARRGGVDEVELAAQAVEYTNQVGGDLDDLLSVAARHDTDSLFPLATYGGPPGPHNAHSAFRSAAGLRGANTGFPSCMFDFTANQVFHTFSHIGYGHHQGEWKADFGNWLHEMFGQGGSQEDWWAGDWGVRIGRRLRSGELTMEDLPNEVRNGMKRYCSDPKRPSPPSGIPPASPER